MKLFLLCAVVFAEAGVVLAQDQSALTNGDKTVSYALGMEVVRQLRMDEFDIDMKSIKAGMADLQAGKPALTLAEKKAAMRQMQADILARAVAKKEAVGELNRKEGQAFLAANAKKPGVKILDVVSPDGSSVQLQYKVLKSGPSGVSPQKADTVVVRYRGTLIDGTPFDLFDDSVKQGGQATFRMADVIPGWSEALQRMKPGDQWRLFVPPSLAYADYGPPEIGMYRTLIYDLELVSFSTNAPPVNLR